MAVMTDPYLWLEDVTADRSLDWVRERNARTVGEYTENSEFSALEGRILELLDTDARIPYVALRGDYLYNFWRDGEHKRGIWRRTSLAEYRSEDPQWDVLLDVDELAEREGENWVWAGASVLRPAQTRALLSFSRGGADASVVREFDLDTRQFVTDNPFDVPEAKTSISWIDENSVYVGTDFGDGSMTDSGYPRIAKRWHRGTPLSEAVTVFEGESTDVSVGASYDDTPGYERHFVGRSIDFYNSERYELLPDGKLLRIDTPDDAGTSVYRDWLTVRPRTDWEVDGTIYPAGSLLVTDYADYLAGSRELTPLFTPDEHTSLEQGTWTRNHLLLVTLSDVQTRLSVLTPTETGWDEKPLDGVPELTASGVISTDARSGTISSSTAVDSPLPQLFSTAPSAGRWNLSSRRPHSSTPTVSRCPSTSSPRTTERRSRTSSYAATTPTVPAPHSCTDTAGSRTRWCRDTAGRSASPGSNAGVRTSSPTFAVAVNTARRGTPRPSAKAVTKCSRTSPQSRATWSRAASPPRSNSRLKVEATAVS